uniref:Uncharacterized protein n=1 Tax=Enterobacter sp. HP19 TaxID=1811975 RepID=A0A2H4UEI5_9ENTR|nr:hypothetical protein [Enterobacter sp. HP19]
MVVDNRIFRRQEVEKDPHQLKYPQRHLEENQQYKLKSPKGLFYCNQNCNYD